MRRTIVVMCTVLAVTAAGCGSGGTSVATRHRADTTTSTASTSTTTRPRTAADDLAAYFAAAESNSEALAAAAKKINVGVAHDQLSFDQATVDAVTAADPTATGLLIPAGLDPALLKLVLIVQNGLVSRHQATRFVRVGTFPTNGYDASSIMSCLGNGAAPAARFTEDLTAAEALAGSTPPVTAVPADSRAAAELAIRLADIRLRNGGCESCGAADFTDLVPIVWVSQPSPPGNRPWDGTAGGVPFHATYGSDGGWRVELNAC